MTTKILFSDVSNLAAIHTRLEDMKAQLADMHQLIRMNVKEYKRIENDVIKAIADEPNGLATFVSGERVYSVRDVFNFSRSGKDEYEGEDEESPSSIYVGGVRLRTKSAKPTPPPEAAELVRKIVVTVTPALKAL